MPQSPQVVILAGGRGERLRPITDTVPKPLVTVNGVSFLLHLLKHLKLHQLTRIILCVGYLHQKIMDYFGDGSAFGVKITYSIESTPLGSGGAVKRAAHLLEGDFFLLNGDTFLPVDYRKVYDFYLSNQKPGLVVVYENQNPDFGRNNIRIENGQVTKFSMVHSDGVRHIATGVGVFNQSVLAYLPDSDVFSFEEVIFNKLIQMDGLGFYLAREPYYDIGTPDRLRKFEEYLTRISHRP